MGADPLKLMPMIRSLLATTCLLLAGCSETSEAPPAAKSEAAANVAAAKPSEPLPDVVRVQLETEAGPIVLALDHKKAPITTANFVRYVDEGRLDGTSFYRAAVTKGQDGKVFADRGFIQGGIRRDYKRMLAPIEHEPTSATGLRHEPGAISMAKSENGAGAMGDFFITVSAQPAMDADGKDEGFAVFGRVEEGMDVVRGIHGAATIPDAGRGAMRGQMLAEPVRIVAAKRVEAKPRS
jgi:peptidyl-prolyl cis-trans isomerase A (cyclophilin A)